MSETDPPLYALRGVTRSFELHGQRVEVLRNIHLELRPRDTVGIRGPSGAGKSTLLHILAMVDTGYTGRYDYREKDVRAVSERVRAGWRLRRLGIAFQDLWLVDSLTAHENLLVPQYAAGRTAEESDARASSLLQNAGLGSVADHRPAELSGGERRRVAFARALSNSPELLLIDEPTAELDAASARAVLGLLDRARAEGTTIVAASHDPTVLSRCGTQFRLEAGGLVPTNGTGAPRG